MLIDFDQTTIANMTAALDQICKKIPPDKDTHETRKQIADAMIACAQSGRRNLSNFQDVGRKTLRELIRPPRSGWFGLRRLLTSR